jgi:hypothetical protein
MSNWMRASMTYQVIAMMKGQPVATNHHHAASSTDTMINNYRRARFVHDDASTTLETSHDA